MPSLSFFANEHDSCLLLDRLNTDPEIAFIVPDDLLGPVDGKPSQTPSSWESAFRVRRAEGGNLELYGEPRPPQRWKAVQAVDVLKDGQHGLWHLPAGPLPLIEIDAGQRSLIGPEGPGYPPIPDPWAGWTGPSGFGPGCHPWIRLELWTRHRPYTPQERIAFPELNAFWLDQGDMLVVSDFQWTGSHFRPAPSQTQRWWNRMTGWMNRNAVRLRTNPGFWAFPSALRKLKDGMRYYSRNFDLDDAIRTAEIPPPA